MKVNNKVISILVSMALVSAPAAFAETQKQDSKLKLGLSANMDADYSRVGNGDWDSNFDADDIHLNASYQLTQKIKAAIRVDLAHAFGAGEAQDKIEKAIEEATITIQDIKGTPVAAIIFGKQKVAFGQNMSKAGRLKENLLYELAHKDEVIGITMELRDDLLKDALGGVIRASVFENQEGDLRIGDGAGFSVSVSDIDLSRIKEGLSANVSGMIMENGNTGDYDKRASLGLVYENGDLSLYGEVLAFDGNVDAPNANFGASAGVAYRGFGPGEVVLEGQILENTAKEVMLAYNYKVPGTALTITPEYRHRFNDNGEDSDFIGVRTKVEWGYQGEQMN